MGRFISISVSLVMLASSLPQFSTVIATKTATVDYDYESVDVGEELQYLKLHTLQQLEAMNVKLEWALSDRLGNGGFGIAKKTPVVRDCADIQRLKQHLAPLEPVANGVYGIEIAKRVNPVYCDMTNSAGGWTLIQRRVDNSTAFHRGWQEYKSGFGDVSTNFWLGNEAIHNLTTGRNYTLRVDMWDWENVHTHAVYASFRVAGEDDHYRLSIVRFPGDAIDAMAHHDGAPFSTYDHTTTAPDIGCAAKWRAGWWFKKCYAAHPNGHITDQSKGHETAMWFMSNRSWTYLMKVEMKIRPSNDGHP